VRMSREQLIEEVRKLRGGIREHLMGAASGATWLILAFYVPLIVVSVVLLVWQLYARRGEALYPVGRSDLRARQTATLTAS